jgi:acyl-lipid omega-6 desaturase (Delta-12 desaturase)
LHALTLFAFSCYPIYTPSKKPSIFKYLSMTFEKDVVAQLNAIVKRYQKPSMKTAIWQMVTSFGPFLLVWALMYLTLDYGLLFTLPLALVNAFFLVRIFIIQHDCGHQSFTKNKRFNNIVGLICGILSFIPYKFWLKSHNYHHGHNGLLHEHRDIGDLELLTVKEYSKLSKIQRFGYRVFRHSVVLFGIVPTYYILIHGRFTKVKIQGWDSAKNSLYMNNALLAAFCAAIYFIFGLKALLLIQLPTLMIFGTIAIWFFYVQHQHEYSYKQWKDKWDYTLAAVQGSTFYNLPRVFHWLTGNIGYHHIHHLSSLIPSYQLAKCHHENPIFDQLAVKMNFRESLSCAFNKLWDEQQQKMITFSEYYKSIGQPVPII